MKIFILTAFAVTITLTSFAQGPGHQRTHIPDHPRVNQVNSRIDNQEKRINQERREGELTGHQARQDRRNLRAINQEKHDMRKEDNGHLTRADQRALNQQLNHNSRRIGH
jgi:hypothetical protein